MPLSAGFLDKKTYDMIDVSDGIRGASTQEALPIVKDAVKKLVSEAIIEDAKHDGWRNYATYQLYEKYKDEKGIVEKAKLFIKEAKNNDEVLNELIDVAATNNMVSWLKNKVQDHIDDVKDLDKDLKTILILTLTKVDWVTLCKQIVLHEMDNVG